MIMPRKPATRSASLQTTSPRRTTVRARWLVPLAVLLSFTLAPHAAGASKSTDTQAQMREHAARLAAVQAQIAKALASLAQARGREAKLQDAVNAAEKKIAHARDALEAVAAKKKAVDAKLAAADRKRTAVTAQLARQRHILAQQLRAQYMLGGGRHEQLQLLLSTRDPSLAGRLLADYGYLQRARSAAIAAVESQLHELAELEARIHTQRQSLATLEAQRRHTLAGLQDAQDKRTRAIAALKADIGRKDARLDALKSSEKQLKELLAALGKQLASVPYEAGNSEPFPKLRGHLPWPVEGTVLAHYGATRAGGPLTWKGTWIAAREGTPVRASARGRVVYVGWVSSYGLIVLLQHDDGYYTLYGHAAEAVVKQGETVAAGQEIATAGDTGGYHRSGVYFEIRHHGQALNPARWLKQ